MSAEANGSPDPRVTVATLRGEVMTELAKITGAVDNLSTELRRDREAREHSDAEHGRIHDDQARDLALLKIDVQGLKDWRLTTVTTEQAAPRLTWGRFFADSKTWLLVALAVAGPLYGLLSH